MFGYGRLFVRAKDVWIWDSQGRRYLDFNAGYGSVNLGHNHPRIIECIRSFLLEEPLNLCHLGPAKQAADLAEALAHRFGESLSVCMFTNSGSEAVESGIKLARAATGRSALVFCDGAYHGLNLGTLSIMGDDRLRRPFEPLLPDCTPIPFGNLDALRSALATKKTAAFIVEPIQCEAGIVLPPKGYLAKAQELCRRHGSLMIVDEVQTGLGRTGQLCAFQEEEFVPDVLVLAKSLSGSIAPIGATLTSPKFHRKAYGATDRCELPFSTFGGNAFSCTVGLETLNIIDDEQLVTNSAERGKQLLDQLRDQLSGHFLIREIRGRGLLVAIEFGSTDKGAMNKICPSLVDMIVKGIFGHWVLVRLLERGVISASATHHWNMLRLEPPLTVTDEHINTLVKVLVEVMNEYRSMSPILKDTAVRFVQQWCSRRKRPSSP